MLSFIRKHSGSVFVKVFLFLIAFTFLFFFGMSDVIRKYTGKDYVVKVGDVKIGPNLLKYECSKRAARFKELGVSDENAIINIVINQLINEQLVGQIAKKNGIIVSDKLIKNYIRSMPEFMNAKTGQFDKIAVRNLMARLKMPEDEFLGFVQRNIEQAALSAPLRGISTVLAMPMYIAANLEKRAIKYVVIPDGAFSTEENIPENEIEGYFDKNKDKFMEPETRDFTVLVLNEDAVLEKISVAEEDIRREYVDSKETEEYDIVHDRIRNTLRNNELEAQLGTIKRNIEDDLMSGMSCQEVATKYSLKISVFKKIEADYNTPAGYKDVEIPFVKDVINTVYQLDTAQDSQFVEALDTAKKKVHWIAHVDAVVPSHVSEYSKVKDKVLAEYRKEKNATQALNMARSYVEKINETMTFDSVMHGFKINTMDGLSRDSDLDSDKMKEAPIDQQVLESIFDLPTMKAGYSKIKNGYIIFQVTSVSDSKDYKKEDVEKYASKLVQEMSEDLYHQLRKYFSKKLEIKINKELLKDTPLQDVDF